MTVITESPSQDYRWLLGNARLIDLSGQLFGAQIAHAGLIMFWAKSITLLTIAVISLVLLANKIKSLSFTEKAHDYKYVSIS
jgi:Photosystem II protein